MKASVKFKICVDIMMTAALYACMAYMLIGEEAHEWIGSGLALLFVLHNALNRKWYAALLTGRYTPLRAFQTAVNLLCLASMAAAAVSGAAMSRYIYDIPFLSGGASLARTVHMLSAYWGYCFISLHLGLHWSMILGMMKNAAAPQNAPRWITPLLRTAGAAAALLGAHALMRHSLLDYMFLRNQFVFFDTERPLCLFFLDYAAIMALWAWLAHYARLALIKVPARKK
ncbi:DUF4405 domain-containing protein [uncultured Cloacibacillus sp.]|uniref:DUF4405 domain-containing protein n=1 Tax=uncultured Cloacibacillus sp. TaxID=889794 RepID=UPI0025CFBD0E|nr:DUF4405 domain-containing protein [uncultured Cloacibacillus sp.]